MGDPIASYECGKQMRTICVGEEKSGSRCSKENKIRRKHRKKVDEISKIKKINKKQENVYKTTLKNPNIVSYLLK